MATVQATLGRPVDEAAAAFRSSAADLGYALAEATGEPQALVFKKGVDAFSWGSQLTVELASASPTTTVVTVTTGETFAITDWGRGKRAAYKLLDAVGAERALA